MPVAYGGGYSAWGYSPLGYNPYEKNALNYINRLYANPSWMAPYNQSQMYLQSVLSGAYSPQAKQYQNAVIQPLQQQAGKSYDRASKNLASNFANYGNYFSGSHGIAQGELASNYTNQLNQAIAQLLYSQFQQDTQNRNAAASQLEALANSRSGLENNLLQNLLAGGSLITGREQYNNQQLQSAIDKAYQDWVRARQEMLLPYAMFNQMVTAPIGEALVKQPSNPWSSLFESIGQGLGLLPLFLL